ncbi:MAG TPA: HAMP domain-containing sensor histidine kinase [Thermoanaerobaculia bacterium]
MVLLLAAAAALFGFHLFIRHVSLLAFNFAGAAEVRALLEQSSRDQKQLSRLDPERGAEYRKRFDEIQDVNRKLDIVALNREEIARRYEWTLLAVVAVLLLAFIVAAIVSGARRERRLAVVQRALEALGRGETDIIIGDRSRDVVGRIAAMIEATSREVDRSRRRIQYLDHLAAWQEAARRHAHEIRTPLTAARMEVDAFASAVAAREPSLAAAATQAQVSIHEELDRLREFTRQFTSFGRIGQPRLKVDDVREVLDEFITLFSGAWPNLTLTLERDDCDCTAALDRELFRQVLVNLCNNSSLAGATRVTFRNVGRASARPDGLKPVPHGLKPVPHGLKPVPHGLKPVPHGLRPVPHGLKPVPHLTIDVADDGPGVDPAIRPRLFQPYTTTRAVGEGMGLGLAICRKIMLDHDGDLEYLDAPGAVFRITLPKAK